MSKPREFRKYDLDAFMPSMNEMADKFVLDNVECDSNIKTQEEKEWAKIIRGAVRVAFISGYNSREKEFDAWKVGHLKQATDFLEISNKQQSEIDTLTAKVKRYEEALISIRDINCKDQVQYMNQEFALYSIHTIARAALNQGEGK